MRALLGIVLVLAGCANLSTGSRYSDASMMTAAAALTKLSAATEANLRYGEASATQSDAEFLAASVEHDPTLLAPFSTYQVKVLRQNGHAAVLICSPDGAVALLEDAGCTAAMDQHRWRSTPETPCAFTVDLVQLCPAVSN